MYRLDFRNGPISGRLNFDTLNAAVRSFDDLLDAIDAVPENFSTVVMHPDFAEFCAARKALVGLDVKDDDGRTTHTIILKRISA